MKQNQKNCHEPVTPDSFEIEALEFPREIIARKLFRQELEPADLQHYNELKEHSPTFRDIVDTMAETIVSKDFHSFEEWMDYELRLTNKFAAIMKKHREAKVAEAKTTTPDVPAEPFRSAAFARASNIRRVANALALEHARETLLKKDQEMRKKKEQAKKKVRAKGQRGALCS